MCHVSITALAALAAAAAGLNNRSFQAYAGSATGSDPSERNLVGDSENGRLFDSDHFSPSWRRIAGMHAAEPSSFANEGFEVGESTAPVAADEIPRQEESLYSEALQEVSDHEAVAPTPSGKSVGLEGVLSSSALDATRESRLRTTGAEKKEAAVVEIADKTRRASGVSGEFTASDIFGDSSTDRNVDSLQNEKEEAKRSLDANEPPSPSWVGAEVARLRARKNALPFSLILSYSVEGCIPELEESSTESPDANREDNSNGEDNHEAEEPNRNGSADGPLEKRGGSVKTEEGVLFGQEARYAAISSLHQRVSRLLQQKRAMKYSEALSPASDLIAAAGAYHDPAQTPGGLETKYLSALQMEIIKKVPPGITATDLLSVTEDLPCVHRRFKDELKFIEEPPEATSPLEAPDSPSQKPKRRLQGASFSSPFDTLGKRIIASTHPEEEGEGEEASSSSEGRSSPAVPPNDPAFPLQWNLRDGPGGGFGINAEKAWRLWSGVERPVVIAVIDSGCDLQHPDLRDKLWFNPGEICGDGIDNDGNGYVDDCHGWDFVRNRGTVVGGASGHGTGASGVLGSAANNSLGVAGVCWGCRIMCLSFIGGGEGSVSHQVQAIDYAVMMGAWISNNSYGGYGKSELEFEAIQRAQRAGHLFVASAGNHNLNTDLPQNDHTPSTYPLSNLISVGAATPEGARAAFSNYGAKSVHLFAPGTDIRTTTGPSGYAVVSGTSFACPHAAGAAGLVWSAFPTLTYLEVKRSLMEGCKPNPKLMGLSACGGTLDLYRALAVAAHIASGVPVDWRSLQEAANKPLTSIVNATSTSTASASSPPLFIPNSSTSVDTATNARPVRVPPLSAAGIAGPIGALLDLGIWGSASPSVRSPWHVSESASALREEELEALSAARKTEEGLAEKGEDRSAWATDFMRQMQSHVERTRALLHSLALDFTRQRLRQENLKEQQIPHAENAHAPPTLLADTARAALGVFPKGLTDVF